jgi:hypothetical protein
MPITLSNYTIIQPTDGALLLALLLISLLSNTLTQSPNQHLHNLRSSNELSSAST